MRLNGPTSGPTKGKMGGKKTPGERTRGTTSRQSAAETKLGPVNPMGGWSRQGPGHGGGGGNQKESQKGRWGPVRSHQVGKPSLTEEPSKREGARSHRSKGNSQSCGGKTALLGGKFKTQSPSRAGEGRRGREGWSNACRGHGQTDPSGPT